MASRRGFGVRLDKAGTRAGGGKAVDIETYVTEYLRDKLLDAEEQLKSGGGDTRLVQQRLSAMEAEVAAAVRLHAEVEMLRSQVHDKNEQIALLKPVSDGETVVCSRYRTGPDEPPSLFVAVGSAYRVRQTIEAKPVEVLRNT